MCKDHQMLKTEIETIEEIPLDSDPITLEKFNDIAFCRTRISFQPSQTLQTELAKSVTAVQQAVADGQVVYGINTGFGAMSGQAISCRDAIALQNNLQSFLAAGAGPEIDSQHVRGAMLLRANVLLQGKSGARIELMQRLVTLLNHDAIPVVREFGSIGASGDLIPLSTVARAVTGHPNVRFRLDGSVVDSQTAFDRLQLEPLELQPKEGLALVNGTSFSSSIAANATNQARNFLAVSFVSQAMLMTALQVDGSPFDPFVHAAKPHPGQIWSAKTIRELLYDGCLHDPVNSGQIQDCYSLRCFPQYAGPIVENLGRIQAVVETEMNSVSDNPLVDPGSGQFFQSGNFLGQYIAVAMDDLRRDIGLLAKHLDVQIALLVSPEFNRGLSPSLRGNDQLPYNMGLKGLQICGNSIMPMLTYFSQPLTHHYPTHAEQFNQNINGLSWGSANLAWNTTKMYSQYLAISLLCGIQALDLRAHQILGHYDGSQLLGNIAKQLYLSVLDQLGTESCEHRPFVFDDRDRWLENDIAALAGDLFAQGNTIQAIAPVIHSFDDQFGAVV